MVQGISFIPQKHQSFLDMESVNFSKDDEIVEPVDDGDEIDHDVDENISINQKSINLP